MNREFMTRLAESIRSEWSRKKWRKRHWRGNDLYIFTHPEFREELQAIFAEALASLPDGEAPPQRLAFEEGRRQALAKARTNMPPL